VVVLAVTGALVVRVTGHRSAAPPSSTRPPASTTQPPAPVPLTTTTVDPGSLPQTGAFPDATGPAFDTRMAALWSGVVTGSVQPALPAFFPESAYVALKAESDAAGDYTGRLLAEYSLDLMAAHALVSNGDDAATLVGVDVDSAYGHWVPPGTCFNGVGYFEVPNSRVVYSVDGQVESFGIASMISWRGEWYVVHLGSVLRSGGGGQVDSPRTGPGAPTYSSTC
jgi:hypothetical protein